MAHWETKSVVEGALLAAITIILSIISVYVPLLNIFASLLCPVPIVLLALRHGWRLSVLATIVSALIVTMIAGPINGIVVLLSVGLVGTALGVAFKKNYSPLQTLLIGSAAALVAQVLLFGAYFVLFRMNMIYDALRLMGESFQHSDEGMRQFTGLMSRIANNPDMLDRFEQQAVQQQEMMTLALDMMWKLIPLTFFVFPAVGGAFLNFSVSRLVLNKLGHKVEGLPAFAEWKMPYWTVWGFLAGIGLMWWGESITHPWLATAGLNLYMLFVFAYMIQGFAVVWFAVKHYKVSRLLRGIILVYIFMMSQFLVWIGLLDGIFDFRKRMTNRQKKKK